MSGLLAGWHQIPKGRQMAYLILGPIALLVAAYLLFLA